MKKERITTFTNNKPKWIKKVMIPIVVVVFIICFAIKPIRKTVNHNVNTSVSIIYEMVKAEKLIKQALYSNGDTYIINLTYKTGLEKEELCD